MRDELLTYYERELSYLREMGAEFAEKYPKIASRLALEPDKCEDPHVERLLEGLALLAGRIHLKIDDEFPEITEALLNSVYPHYLRPIPSMSIAEFETDPDTIKPETGLLLPRGASLVSQPVNGLPCRFRTCYDLTFWPIRITGAQWRAAEGLGPGLRASETAGAFRIELEVAGGRPFSSLPLDALRFYINAESELAHMIYELMLNNCVQVTARDRDARPGAAAVTIPPSALRAAGFGPEEAALPYSGRSFAGYQIIQEYFAFPQKFLFFELHGLARAAGAGLTDRVELQFVISRFEREDRRRLLETAVTARTFRLGCTPVVNLFPQTAEPVLFDQRKPEYPVIPDAARRHAMEVFSIEEVLSVDPRTQAIRRFEPFHSVRHDGQDSARRYWQATRRSPSRPHGEGYELYLSLVDASGAPAGAGLHAITVRTLCTNRDLPSRLPFGNPAGDFELEGAQRFKKIVALVKPTETLRPPAARDAFWRLASQLSLNYLSLVEDGGASLREILRLYNFSGSTSARKQIEGIVEVSRRQRFAPLPAEGAPSFARGTQVEIVFDEEQFVGGGVYLFASALENFLGQYVSMNSFSQLLARTRQRKEVLKSWPPRAGRKALL